MNKVVLSLLIALLPLNCVFGDELTLLGTIPFNCHPVITTEGDLAVPAGFTISPEQAIDIAVENAGLKCGSKLEQELYLDNANYYIIKSIYIVLDKSPAIVINGRTGIVSSRGQK